MPAEHMQTLVEHMQTLVEHMQTLVEHMQAPVEHMQAPVEHMQAPVEPMQPSVEHMQALVEHMQAPVVNNEFIGCTRRQSDSHTHAGVEKTPQVNGRSTGKLVVLEGNLTRIHTPAWRTHHK